MKKYFHIFFLTAYSLIFPQNPDSLFDEIISLKNGANKQIEKCAFNIFAAVRLNYEQFSPEQKKTIDEIFSRPVCDVSLNLQDGNYVLHYDTSGLHVPSYPINELVTAFDSITWKEINEMNFPEPPKDFAGNNSGYDIYIQNIGSVYGYTVPEYPLAGNDSAYTSFIVINSDFSGFYTEGINAAKVTLAHEFNHAIQIGNYILRYSDLFFYELTSTSMEEFVFPQVNDYVNYLGEYFYNPDLTFSDYSGYNLGIWNLFLAAKFGNIIFTEQWENMTCSRAIYSIEKSLVNRGSSFTDELLDFGTWVFFSGHRTKEGEYFADAREFPELQPSLVFSVPPSYPKNFSLAPVSTFFVRASVTASSHSDTVTLLLANGDAENVFTFPRPRNECELTIYDNPDEGESALAEYSFDFESEREETITLERFINGDFASTREKRETNIFPQPFILSKHSALYIRTKESFGKAKIIIYDTAMKVIATKNVYPNGDGKTVKLNKNFLNLPSGIYIFAISYNDKIQKGKFAIINER